ncbi:MAG: outer membrane protein assembly factor BamC [Pseudomonadales bacterium]|jgi:outer membrane protein assembly factor BamC|nr:outer membrane protein assembly factor BamC [Pseudomonadales bacterium]
MSLVRVLALAACVLSMLSSCRFIYGEQGLIKDREQEYRAARAVDPPEIPADLDGSNIGDMMFVPDVGGMDQYLAEDEFELPRPATLFAPEEERQVRIQRFGDDEWVVAPDPPSVIWPRIKQFLSDNGVAVVAEIPEAGVLETEWLAIQAQGYRDVVRSVLAEGQPEPFQALRIRVEQAVRRGATEVHMVQQGVDRIVDDTPWPEVSTRPAAASSLLREMAGYLAAEVPGSGISLRAQNIASESKAEVLTPRDGQPALRLRLPFARAWATVGTALTNAAIEVEASDRDARSFVVRFDPLLFEGAQSSWLSNLFSFGRGPEGGDAFRLDLIEAPDGFDLRVLDPESGRPIGGDRGEQILSVIREYAS